MTKRIGILTGGSDAPGQNVCLKALVHNALDDGFDVIGIRKGWEGLLHYQLDDPETHSMNVIMLTKPRVHDVDRMGGSYLHSSRLNPGAAPVELLPAFLRTQASGTQDTTDHIKQVIRKLQLDALIVMGDHAVLNYAARLQQEGVPIIGIPKTVHNSVAGTDYTLGFSSALGRGVHFVREIRALAASREEIAVIEILGRDTGLTTMLIGLLAGSDRTLIPEVPFDPERLALLLEHDKQLNPNNYAILVTSEAASIHPDKVDEYARVRRTNHDHQVERVAALVEPDEYALVSQRGMGVSVAGSGVQVTEILETLLQQRMLLQPLSYLIRTGDPDGQDLLGAVNFARKAIDLVNENKSGRMVAYHRGENYVDVPLQVVRQEGGNYSITEYYDEATYTAKPGILWSARM